MTIKYKKPKYLIILIPFGLLLVFGILGLIFLDEKHKIFYNLLVTLSSLGTLTGFIMFIYSKLFFHESEFSRDFIYIKKNKTETTIPISMISNLEYEKPTLINYLTVTNTTLLPGILRVNLKEKVDKKSSYFIKLKYNDFQSLPQNFKNLLKYPVV